LKKNVKKREKSGLNKNALKRLLHQRLELTFFPNLMAFCQFLFSRAAPRAESSGPVELDDETLCIALLTNNDRHCARLWNENAFPSANNQS